MTASLADLAAALPSTPERRLSAGVLLRNPGVSYGLVLRGCHCAVCGAEDEGQTKQDAETDDAGESTLGQRTLRDRRGRLLG